MIVNKTDIRKLFRVDSVFRTIDKQYGKPPNWSRPPGFVSLSRIILEQQVSLASANAHFQKLNSYLPAFTPVTILQLTDNEMRACQVSRQKTKYLRELSTALITKTIDLESFHTLDVDEIRKQLTSIKGIGNWTTDIYLMFCLQEKDIFPAGDIAILTTVRELWDAKTTKDILALTERWKSLRSLASYYLWHHYLKKRNRIVDG